MSHSKPLTIVNQVSDITHIPAGTPWLLSTNLDRMAVVLVLPTLGMTIALVQKTTEQQVNETKKEIFDSLQQQSQEGVSEFYLDYAEEGCNKFKDPEKSKIVTAPAGLDLGKAAKQHRNLQRKMKGK